MAALGSAFKARGQQNGLLSSLSGAASLRKKFMRPTDNGPASTEKYLTAYLEMKRRRARQTSLVNC